MNQLFQAAKIHWSALALVVCLLAAQEDAPKEIRDFVRDLRSESIAVRERAAQQLEDLGSFARPFVARLLDEADLEMRERAGAILRRIAQAERVRTLGIPSKAVTLNLEKATLDDALRRLFTPFGFAASIEGVEKESSPPAISCNLRSASLWETMDALSKEAQLEAFGLRELFHADAHCHELSFVPPAGGSLGWDTIGELRVFATPAAVGELCEGGDFTILIAVASPWWATPKRIRVDNVRVFGEAVRVHPASEQGEEELPREKGKITVVSVFQGKDLFNRSLLKGGRTLTVEGMLRVIKDSGQGDQEVSVPFAIRDLRLPLVR